MTTDKIDIRIFGVPERWQNIARTVDILSIKPDRIIIDTNHNGCIPTAKKAWSIPTDKPYVMVMADDAELCSNFTYYLEKIIDLFPDEIVSLFPIQFCGVDPKGNNPKESPYVSTIYVSGLATIMPTKFVKPCIDSWRDDIRGDDTNIQMWAKANDIPIITTLPSIVQHIGDDSVFDSSRRIGRTIYYSEDPSYMDWDNRYVTSWTNIIR